MDKEQDKCGGPDIHKKHPPLNFYIGVFMGSYMDAPKWHEALEVISVFILGLSLKFIAGRSCLQDGKVIFFGYDEFYHMRRILYTVSHFPNAIWFDSYVNYPYGGNITWPPLFDQLIAAVAWVLGRDTQHEIELVGAIMPAIIGSITILVVYFMIKELFDRNVALFSAFMAAIAPNYLLRTMIGVADHHCLEVLLFLLFIMFLIFALTRAERRSPFAIASGVCMAALAYTWLGAALYFAVILIYFALQITVDINQRSDLKETLTPTLTALGIALALTLPFRGTDWLSSSFTGLVGIIFAIILLSGLGRAISGRSAHWAALPAAALALAGVLILMAKLFGGFGIMQRLGSLVISGQDYVFSGGFTGMISEAEPLFARPDILFSNGWSILLSIVALLVLVRRMRYSWPDVEKRKGLLLFLVFAAYSLMLTFGQVRFLYISSITTGILISILFFSISEYVTEASRGHSKLLLSLLFLLLVLPVVSHSYEITKMKPAIDNDWIESIKWLEQNSNTTSYWNDASKTPEYSVLCWWDYGNWVLYGAKRPVVANNFQYGVGDATKFYLSEDEKAASAILDSRGSKYVITDYKMISSKIRSIALWAGKDPSDYITIEQDTRSGSPKERWYKSTVVRLQAFDGDDMGHMRLIHESPTAVAILDPPVHMVKIFEYVPGAVIKVAAENNQRAAAFLNVTTNQGRSFIFIKSGVPVEGGYEIRVPYSTERRYDTHATDSYLVAVGDDAGTAKFLRVNVTEDDVTKGEIIDLTAAQAF